MIDVDISPEAAVRTGAGAGWYVVSFSSGGYWTINKTPGPEGACLPVFRSAADAEECIVHANAHEASNTTGAPFPLAATDAQLLKICGIAVSEGVRYYAINPPTTTDFTGHPMHELMGRLYG